MTKPIVPESEREEFEVYCVHSMVKWWCLGCVQGHARRVEAENARLREALVGAGVPPDLVADIAQPAPRRQLVPALCNALSHPQVPHICAEFEPPYFDEVA